MYYYFSPKIYKYTGLNWLSKKPSDNWTDRDPSFRPNIAALKHVVDMQVYTCGICGEGLIGFRYMLLLSPILLRYKLFNVN